MEAAVLFIVFAILLFMGAPIAVCLGVSSIAAMLVMLAGRPVDIILGTVPQLVSAATSKAVLQAIPFFILGGNIMDASGISRKLIHLAEACVGHLRGGVAMVCVLVACFFAAISGSGPATVAALGIIVIPALVKAGYDVGFAAALMATAGAIGVIIPPSITFVVYGSISDTSIGDLFIAGVLPGLVMGAALIAVTFWLGRKKELTRLPKASGKERWKAFKDAFWGLLMPVIILGGIYGGIFTPTEAAVVAVVYSVLIGKFVYKELDGKTLYECLRTTGLINGATEFMIGLSMAFASYLAMAQIPAHIASWMTSLAHSPFILLMVINVFLLVIGCFVDNIAAVIILTPILLPVVKTIGIDPIHFGLIITVNLACGFISPPYGINLFVASAISGESIESISKSILPSFMAMVVCLLLFTYFPVFSLGLLQWLR